MSEEAERWDIHRELTGLPSVVAAYVLAASYFSSLAGIVAALISIVAFAPIHRLVFGKPSRPQYRSNALALFLVISGQAVLAGCMVPVAACALLESCLSFTRAISSALLRVARLENRSAC
jgi:hypothetical protein